MNKQDVAKSLKVNLTMPYSSINAMGREVLAHAQLRECVEFNKGGSWLKNRSAEFHDKAVYRITPEYSVV